MKEDKSQEIINASKTINSIIEEIQKVVVGQKDFIEKLIIALMCNGHVLIEGIPGLAKTLTVIALSKSIKADFSRIQFTPDLMPSDLIGTLIFNNQKNEFVPHKGPIFSQIVLADEINRAPAKVQSALLEAMQEHQVSIGNATYKLDEPFIVFATQNPIEQEGTFPLPEAQLDRFMFLVRVSYPDEAQELNIMKSMGKTKVKDDIVPVLSPDDIFQLRKLVDSIYVDEKIEKYIIRIVRATRNAQELGIDSGKYIKVGASVRASINMILAAKAKALLAGRDYVSPEDVKLISVDVLRHRLILSYEAFSEKITSDDIIKDILNKVEIV
ncbi:MAG: AAA family ATPase [Opitutales bacterium]